MKFEKSMKSVAAASSSRRRTVAQPVYVDLSRANRHGRASDDVARSAERPAPRQRTVALADLGLTRVEDALLDAILDNHRNRDSALDRLLDDMACVDRRHRDEMEAAAGDDDAPALPVDGYAVPKLQRIEQLLVAAVLDNHPNRNRALDRLFDDIEAEEARERAQFDMTCDNDFDGMA